MKNINIYMANGKKVTTVRATDEYTISERVYKRVYDMVANGTGLFADEWLLATDKNGRRNVNHFIPNKCMNH